ncbi:MAG: hypothetical protein R2860_04580 [Desulfobacterales bacterium]
MGKARLGAENLDFDLIIEGFITENRTCAFNAGFDYENVDFLVADAPPCRFRSAPLTR